MGAAFLRLTVPDLSLGDVGGAKITTAVVNSRAEGPRGLERWDTRTGRALSGDEFGGGKEGNSSDEHNERTHDWWSPVKDRKGAVGLSVRMLAYKTRSSLNSNFKHMERIANVCRERGFLMNYLQTAVGDGGGQCSTHSRD